MNGADSKGIVKLYVAILSQFDIIYYIGLFRLVSLGGVNMEIQVLPLIIVCAYLVGMLIVGFIVSKLKIKNSKDYLVAGRRMGLFMVAFSLSGIANDLNRIITT